MKISMKGDLSSYKKTHNMNNDHFPKRTWKAGQDVVIAFQKKFKSQLDDSQCFFFQSRRLDKSRTLLPDSSDDLNEPKPLQV